MPDRPKRHHQVPRFFLQRFAVDDKVRVRWRDGRTYETSTLNVAVESGFYDLPEGAGGTRSRAEEAFAQVESAALPGFRLMDSGGEPPPPDSDERSALATFIALQMTRTTQPREQMLFPERLAEWAAGREINEALVAEYLERVHLGFAPRDREAEGAFLVASRALADGVPSSTWVIEMMLRMVAELIPRLLAMTWTIESSDSDRLFTSDTPVVVWGKPKASDEYQGIGIDNAAELRFPLDPGKQLVLSKRKRLPAIEVAPHRVTHCDAAMAEGCHRFIVGAPPQVRQLDRAHLETKRPVIRFNVGPLHVVGPSGDRVRESEVVHMWIPRRPVRR